jgi:hypothetical protein
VGRSFSRRLAVFGPVNGPALDALLSAGRPLRVADLLQGFTKLGSDRRINVCRAVRARLVTAGSAPGRLAIVGSCRLSAGIGSRVSWSGSDPRSQPVRSRADEEAVTPQGASRHGPHRRERGRESALTGRPPPGRTRVCRPEGRSEQPRSPGCGPCHAKRGPQIGRRRQITDALCGSIGSISASSKSTSSAS